tara:strand:- start:1001 stop:1834 length:834 start_codon:yes stop_codon:yes gene_type:complete
MAFHFDEVHTYEGQHLVCQEKSVPKALGVGPQKVNHTSYIQGNTQIGKVDAFSSANATLMVGREDTIGTDRSVYVNGNQYINGDSGTSNALYVTGGGSVDSLYVDGDVYVTGRVDCGNKGRLASRFSSADARPKPFDLKHPSREGYRLRYACIEGPEVGVYVRGRVKDEKVIDLPKYWKDLVHEDSITVQLQPIGAHQDIIVEKWDDEKIYLQSKEEVSINCFYHVYAERKDINPLITEYEGETCDDYPDPNHHSIPDDERNYKDPNYATEQNTKTK